MPATKKVLTLEELYALLKDQAERIEQEVASNWADSVKAELVFVAGALHAARLKIQLRVLEASSGS